VSRTTAVGRSAPPPRLGDVLEFMRLIWALDHALQSTSKRMKSSLGVTGPQRLVIRIVSRFPGITAGQIAEMLHVHPSTLTGVLKRLEATELVRRRSDPNDRRRAILGVTEKGRQIEGAGAGTVENAVERVITRTPRAHLDHARDVLIDLAASLSEDGPAGPLSRAEPPPHARRPPRRPRS
jgi:MarR family transcriptional regulator, organic hydroperoxide resistance regulator